MGQGGGGHSIDLLSKYVICNKCSMVTWVGRYIVPRYLGNYLVNKNSALSYQSFSRYSRTLSDEKEKKRNCYLKKAEEKNWQSIEQSAAS